MDVSDENFKGLSEKSMRVHDHCSVLKGHRTANCLITHLEFTTDNAAGIYGSEHAEI